VVGNSVFAMARSKADIEYFYKWLGYTWGKHIGEWMDLYGERKGAQVHRVCVIAPRDHSKSTTLRVKLLHQCLFEKWRDKPFTIWLFSASKDLAIRRLEEIREDLKRHPELSRYIDPRRGNKLELRLTNGAWIRATSVGSAIRGEHPAAIAFDDVLDDMGDMNMNVVREWFRKKVTPMLSPGTSIYVVGTPMSMNDLYHTEMLESEVWKSGVWSAIENWDAYKEDPENNAPQELWPEYRPIDFLMEQKQAMGELSFIQEYLCRVVDDEAAVYPRMLIRKNLNMEGLIEAEKLHDDSRYVIGFDPSHGLGRDYSVIAVVRQDSEGFVHLVNLWRRNDFSPDRQADVLIELLKAYGNPPLAAEDVGFQQMYASLLAQKGAVVDYKKSRVSNRTLKQGLMNRLRVWFEREKLIFPYGDDSTRRTVEILLAELETHAWRDGLIVDLGKHNDAVMAFAHAVDQLQIPNNPMPVVMGSLTGGEWIGGNKETLPRQYSGGIGGVARKSRF